MSSEARSNVSILYLSKVFQLAFPLLLLFLVANRIGVEQFGYLSLAQNAAIFTSMLIEFGFGYTGARDVGKNRGNLVELGYLVYNVFYSKLILCVGSIILLTIFLLLYRLPTAYFLGAILLCLGQGFTPFWFYQGMGNVRIVVTFDLISKLIVIIFVWLFVTSSSNGYIYLLSLGFFQALTSIALNFYIMKSFKRAKFRFWKIYNFLKDSYGMFIFRLGSLIYGGGSIAILGFVADASTVGTYAIADRLFRAAASVTSPVGEAFFGTLCAQESENPQLARKTRQTAVMLMLFVCMSVFLVGEFSSKFLLSTLFNNYSIRSTSILNVLLVSILFIGSGTCIFVLYLLPKGNDKPFAIATALAGLWTVFSILVFVPRFGIEWMAWTIVIAEIIITIIGIIAIILTKRRKNVSQAI